MTDDQRELSEEPNRDDPSPFVESVNATDPKTVPDPETGHELGDDTDYETSSGEKPITDQTSSGEVSALDLDDDPDLAERAPVPGWYSDPHNEASFRWWDGKSWQQKVDKLPGDEPLLSDSSATNWLRRSMRILQEQGGELLPLVVLLLMIPMLLRDLLAWYSLRGVGVRLGTEAGVSAFEITGFRGWDPASVLALAMFLLNFVFAACYFAAATSQGISFLAGESESWKASIIKALDVLPRLVAVGLARRAVMLAPIGLLVAFSLLLSTVAPTGFVAFVVLPLGIVAVVLTLFIWVRVSLTESHAVIGARRENSLKTSWSLTGRNFLEILVRLLLLIVVSIGLSFVSWIVLGLFSGVGVGAEVEPLPDEGVTQITNLLGATAGAAGISAVIAALTSGITQALGAVGLALLYGQAKGSEQAHRVQNKPHS